MRHILFAVVAALLFSYAANTQTLIALDPIGVTNGPINKTDTLDALIFEQGHFILKKTEVKTDSAFSETMGHNTPVYKIESEEEPIMLFKNHFFLRGKINGQHLDNMFLFPNTAYSYQLGNKKFVIKATGNEQDFGNYRLIRNYTLSLDCIENSVTKNYVIATFDKVQAIEGFETEGPKIIWIGDLNGDNKLDIILNESNHYAQINRSIYLSDKMKPHTYPKTLNLEGAFD